MARLAWAVVVLFAFSGSARAAQDRDPLVRARLLYNDGKWDEAMLAADQARANPTRTDSADLIVARIRLERFRERADPADLVGARDALRSLNPLRFSPRERAEFIVGLGEALYLDGMFGAAAAVFE